MALHFVELSRRRISPFAFTTNRISLRTLVALFLMSVVSAERPASAQGLVDGTPTLTTAVMIGEYSPAAPAIVVGGRVGQGAFDPGITRLSRQQASQTVPSFAELRSLLSPGETIYVVDLAGKEVRGKLVELSRTSARLTVGDKALDVTETDISAISRRRPDSLANGALTGLVVGLGFSLAGLAICEGCSGSPVGPMVVYTGIAVAAGTLVDMAIPGKKEVIYRKAVSRGPDVSLMPFMSNAQGLGGFRAFLRKSGAG